MTRSRPSSRLLGSPLGRTALLAPLTLLCLAVAPASAQSWVSTDLAPEIGIPLQFLFSLLVYVVAGGIVNFVVGMLGAGAMVKGYNDGRKQQGKRAV